MYSCVAVPVSEEKFTNVTPFATVAVSGYPTVEVAIVPADELVLSVPNVRLESLIT
jgi:hypothetical protein